MLYLLRGDDTTRFRDVIASMKSSMGEPSLADLNTSVLDGDSLSFETLHTDALTLPFLTSRRLIIIEKGRNFLERAEQGLREKILRLSEDLPDSTALVFEVEDQQMRRRNERFWENEKAYGWMMAWLQAHPDRALLVDCSLPDDEDMPGWMIKKCKAMGAGIRPDAAHLLASYIGNDTLRAEQELEKLINFVGVNQVIAPEDVTLLTAQGQEGNIFALTDALGDRNGPCAMKQLELLNQSSELIEILAMIDRQIRQLIQAREILDEGGNASAVEADLHVPSFLAVKLTNQARRFEMAQLLLIFKRLLKIDEEQKTGGRDGEVSLDLLIAELTA